MAVYSNLSGSGAIGLSAGVSQLRVDVVTFGNGTSIGSAAPADYFKLGALRLGNQGSYYPVRYIDGASIILDCPPGVTTLGYNLFTTTVVTVTEVFAAVANWEKQPWDRNPAPVLLGSTVNPPGGTNDTVMFSYTVPAGRIMGVTHGIAEITPYQPPSANWYVNAYVYLGSQVLLQAILGAQTSVPQNADQLAGGTLYLPAGTVLVGHYGNFNVGGSVWLTLLLSGYLFDA